MQQQSKIQYLAFVHREKEAHQIADALLSNRSADSVSGQPYIVTAGQMYGSGETEMGKNSTKAITVYEHRKQELIAKYGDNLVNEYVNAEYVLVDFCYLPSAEEISPFKKALAYLLYISFYRFIEELKQESKPTIKKFCQQVPLNTPLEVLEYFLERFPTKAFFVHWDEVL